MIALMFMISGIYTCSSQMLQWEKWISEPNPSPGTSSYLRPVAISPDSSSGFYIAASAGQGSTSAIARFFSNGEMQWIQPIGTIDKPIIITSISDIQSNEVILAGGKNAGGPISIGVVLYETTFSNTGDLVDSNSSGAPTLRYTMTRPWAVSHPPAGDWYIASPHGIGIDKVGISHRGTNFEFLHTATYLEDDSNSYAAQSLGKLISGDLVMTATVTTPALGVRKYVIVADDTCGFRWATPMADTNLNCVYGNCIVSASGSLASVGTVHQYRFGSDTGDTYIIVRTMGDAGAVMNERVFHFDQRIEVRAGMYIGNGDLLIGGRVSRRWNPKSTTGYDTASQFWMMHLNAALDSVGTVTWGPASNSCIYAMTQIGPTQYIIAGMGGNHSDMYVASIDRSSLHVREMGPVVKNIQQSSILVESVSRDEIRMYCNTTSPVCTVAIYDIVGNQCSRNVIDMGGGKTVAVVVRGRFQPGVYAVVFDDGVNGYARAAICVP